MPTIEKLGPVAIEHQKTYGPQIKESPTGYAFSIPINDVTDVYDFSFLDYSKKRLDIALPITAKDIYIRVPRGVEVHAQDNFNTFAKVRVIHPDGPGTYKARDSVHESNHDHRNMNGKYPIKDLTWDTNRYPVNQSFSLTTSWSKFQFPASEFEDHVTTHYMCRHLVVASILTKQQREIEKKNPPEAGQRPLPWWVQRAQAVTASGLENLLGRKDMAEVDYYRMIVNSPNMYGLDSFNFISEGIAALLQQEAYLMKREGLTEKSKDFAVKILNSGESGSHALHLSIKVKQEPDGNVLYKAKLYDPNVSYTHKSVATKDLNVIKELSLSDWLKENYDQYNYSRTEFFEVDPDYLVKTPTPHMRTAIWSINPYAPDPIAFSHSEIGDPSLGVPPSY